MDNIDLASLSSGQRDDVLHSVKQQLALANAQELVQKLSDKCIKRCIIKPGTSLDKSEEKCLANCMDRFMETWNLVSRSYQQQLQNASTGFMKH